MSPLTRSLRCRLLCLCVVLAAISAQAGDAVWPVLNAGLSDVPNLEQRVGKEGADGVALAPTAGITFAKMRAGDYGCVQTSFGMNAHIMLFRFGPGGEVRAARTMSFHKAWNGNAAVWVWVLPSSAVEHSVRLLQTDAALATGDALNLMVREWPTGGDSQAPELDASTLSVGDSTSTIGGVDAATQQRVFEPMVLAAGVEAGFRVSPSGRKVTVQLRALLDANDIRLTDGDRVLEMRHVAHADTYGALQRLFLALRAGPSVIGVAAVSDRAPTALAATEKALLLEHGRGLSSLDITTGRLLWPKQANPERPVTVTAQALTHEDGRVTVVGTDPGFGLLDPMTGELAAAFAGKAAAPEAICLDAAGRVAFARGDAVTVYADGGEVWTRKLAAAVVAGPRETGAGLAVLTADRTLWLLAADGTPKKLATVAAGLGQLISAGDQMVCLVGSREVYAIPAAGGKAIETTLSDVVKAAEPVAPGVVLAWTGDNRLRILVAGSEAPRAERVWPTWIRGVSVIGTGDRRLVAVADMGGTLTLLDPATLETRQTMDMGMDLMDAPRALSLPVPWPPAPTGRTGTPVATADEVSDDAMMAATIVAAKPRRVFALRDRTGFIFLIAPEKL